MIPFKPSALVLVLLLAGCSSPPVTSLNIPLHAVNDQGIGTRLGTVKVTPSLHGLVFTPDLGNLEPGAHGFHLHRHPSCAPTGKGGQASAAAAAGRHWDPEKTDQHGAPWGDGHLGDLPALLVTADGEARQPVLAPRLDSLNALRGLSLMVHAGGDNHADHPQPQGGGGARIGCGVIE